MKYDVGQRYIRRFGMKTTELVLIGDPDGMWLEVAEQDLSDPEKYERYLMTSGNLDDEQEIGFIERDGDVSEERLAEIREAVE